MMVIAKEFKCFWAVASVAPGYGLHSHIWWDGRHGTDITCHPPPHIIWYWNHVILSCYYLNWLSIVTSRANNKTYYEFPLPMCHKIICQTKYPVSIFQIPLISDGWEMPVCAKNLNINLGLLETNPGVNIIVPDIDMSTMLAHLMMAWSPHATMLGRFTTADTGHRAPGHNMMGTQ